MDVDLKNIKTEGRNPKTLNIDMLPTNEVLKLINDEDKTIAYIVEGQIDNIGKLVDDIVEKFNIGGRLIYMGAGTSGRVGIIDAVECRPTYGVSDEMVRCMMAGGINAFVKAVEGAEDNYLLGKEDLQKINLSDKDVVVGIAASGRTPYVIGGLDYANSIGCVTGCIVTSQNSPIANISKHKIECITGPECITGSTRMKAGTCQKMVCNMISTCSMIKMGKVYSNLMIDVQPTNEKLVSRAKNILMTITGIDETMASSYLMKFKSVKKALFSLLTDINDENIVDKILEENNGHIRKALESVKK